MTNDRNKPVKCPNSLKGTECWVCGASYVCVQPWRKKRTFKERIAARREDAKLRREQASR